MARGRDLTTSELAAVLRVAPETVRYQAQQGNLPHHVTPGGHRRFDLDEVERALNRGARGEVGTPAHVPTEKLDFGLDLSTPPSGELNESARMLIAGTAGYDERLLDDDPEVLPSNFIDAFAVPGTARYPQKPYAIGAGL